MKRIFELVLMLALTPVLYSMQNQVNPSSPQGRSVEDIKPVTEKLEMSSGNIEEVRSKATLKNLLAQEPASNDANNAQNQEIPGRTNAQKIKVIMNDKQEVVIDKTFLEQCPTLNNMLTDLGNVDEIELPDNAQITAKSLSKIIELMKSDSGGIIVEINNLETDEIIEIISCVNYLELSEVLDIGLKAFAAKLSNCNEIEHYLGNINLPKELMQRMLKLIGATNCFMYRSSFTQSHNKITDWYASHFKSAFFIPGNPFLVIWDGSSISLVDLKTTSEPSSNDLLKYADFFVDRPIFNQSLVAYARANTDTTIELLKLNNLERSELRWPGNLFPCCITADATLIAIDQECKIYLFDTISKELKLTLPTTGCPMLSPDGELIFICPSIFIPDKGCYLYSKEGKLAHSFVDIESKVCAACFSPDSSLIAIGCDDGTTYLYDIKSEKCKKIMVSEGSRRVRSLCFSNDNSLIAIAESSAVGEDWITILNVNLGKRIDAFLAKNYGCFIPYYMSENSNTLFFNSDNTALICNFNLSGSETEKCVIIRDLNAHDSVLTLKGKRLEGYNSDYSLISGLDVGFFGVWAIDKSLENYLCQGLTIDQSMLLVLIFKAIQTNLIVTVPGDSKLKAIYDSIAHENLKKVISSYIRFDQGESQNTRCNDESKNTPQRKRKRPDGTEIDIEL